MRLATCKIKWDLCWKKAGVQHSPFDMPSGYVNLEIFSQLKLPIKTCSANAKGARSFGSAAHWI